MTLPKPPHYVVVPIDAIDQAFVPDKPKRALLGSFVRILSLAWEAKYQQTPLLDEDELMVFLKLSRRQYFEQKADMEMLGWLRSSHPRPGFVRFSFSRSIIEMVGAENPELGAKNRTESSLIGGGESLINLNTDSTPPIKENPSAENRTFPSVAEILKHTHLLFDGAVVISKGLESRLPTHVLGWCAYAFSQKDKLTAPGGVVRNRLLEGEAPPDWTLESWPDVLPVKFLETLKLIRFECDVCRERFETSAELESHKAQHVLFAICPICLQKFVDQAAADAHYDEVHKPDRIIADDTVTESIRRIWEDVLDELQLDMPRASFDTWVRDTQPVRYHGNALTVGTRNAYAKDWLTNRLTKTIEKVLRGIMKDEIGVSFVVAELETEE